MQIKITQIEELLQNIIEEESKHSVYNKNGIITPELFYKKMELTNKIKLLKVIISILKET